MLSSVSLSTEGPFPNSRLALLGSFTEIGVVKFPFVEKKNVSYTPDTALSVIAKYAVPLVYPSASRSTPFLPCGV